MTPTKHPITEIELHRAEGKVETRSCKTVAEADAVLARWSHSVHGKSYDKVDVTITWENGLSYKCRYDLYGPEGDPMPPHVLTSLIQSVELVRGNPPEYLTAELCAATIDRMKRFGLFDVLAQIGEQCALA